MVSLTFQPVDPLGNVVGVRLREIRIENVTEVGHGCGMVRGGLHEASYETESAKYVSEWFDVFRKCN